jgi:hypothetical protein
MDWEAKGPASISFSAGRSASRRRGSWSIRSFLSCRESVCVAASGAMLFGSGSGSGGGGGNGSGSNRLEVGSWRAGLA